MTGEMMSTAELLAATHLTKRGLDWRRGLYPELISPAGRIAQTLLWKRDMVAVILGLNVRRSKRKAAK